MASKQRSQATEQLEQHLVDALTDADTDTLIKTPRRLATESNLDVDDLGSGELALAIRELAADDSGRVRLERWGSSRGSSWQISLADDTEGDR